MKPMLAFKYQDKKKHLTFPCHVQPKLNGIRMLYQDGVMQSRSHGLDEPKEWPEHRLTHIREALKHVPSDIILDGELYIHGISLQKINSYAAINRINDIEGSSRLEYHIFDCCSTDEPTTIFNNRAVKLIDLFYDLRYPICLVPTFMAATLEIAEQHFKAFVTQGFEGAMYRQSNSPYGHEHMCKNKENRWPYLLKRKDWLDEEFEIVDFFSTTGAKGEQGFNCICKLPNGQTFSVGSGLSDLEVDRYLLGSSGIIGRMATVKFEMYSDAGIPLKPSILEIS